MGQLSSGYGKGAEGSIYHGHGRVLRPEVEHGRERPEGSKEEFLSLVRAVTLFETNFHVVGFVTHALFPPLVSSPLVAYFGGAGIGVNRGVNGHWEYTVSSPF